MVGPEQSGAHGEVPARVPTDELSELEEPDQDVIESFMTIPHQPNAPAEANITTPVAGVHDLLTHKPADTKGCEACMLGKSRNVRKIAGASDREFDRFGQLVTCDHKYFQDSWGLPGVRGHRYVLTILDRGTGNKGVVPAPDLTSFHVAAAINTFKGSEQLARVYSDGAEHLVAACKQLGINHEKSRPGIPQTNGVIERCNSDVVNGVRASTSQAGVPDCLWPEAAPCYCHHDNVTIGEDGLSPWAHRHGKEWEGRLFPFGCLVTFRPSETKYHLSGHTARMQSGVLMGYEIHPGQTWNGEYRVLDLSGFAGKPLNAQEPASSFSCAPHKTKVVRRTRHGAVFPLRERYERDNDTRDGIEASTHYKEWGNLPEPPLPPPAKDPNGGALGSASKAEDSAQQADPRMAFNFDPFLPEELLDVPTASPDVATGSSTVPGASYAPKFWYDQLNGEYPLLSVWQYHLAIEPALWGAGRRLENASKKQRKEMRQAFAEIPHDPR